MARYEYRQAYNARAIADADGSRLVPASDVLATSNDRQGFDGFINEPCRVHGEPGTLPAMGRKRSSRDRGDAGSSRRSPITCFMNRRIRNRTYGGVRGRREKSRLLPDPEPAVSSPESLS